MVTRNRLEVRMQETLVSLLQALTARERWSEVLEYSQQLLELEPCSQEAHLGVMKAYLTQGQPELALRQFETCRVTLKKELQLDPSPALLELRQRCLMA
jgi:DNA-binding SARP family transcriptional activator